MVINASKSILNGPGLLRESSRMVANSLARLTSGSKLFSPEKKDAAEPVLSTDLRERIRRTAARGASVGRAISFSRNQEAALSKICMLLERMQEVALRAQEGTKTDADRIFYNAEFSSLCAHVTTTGLAGVAPNGAGLFGSSTLSVVMDDGETLTLPGVDLGAVAYAAASGSSVSTPLNATMALTQVRAALVRLAADRATIRANLAKLSSLDERLAVLKGNLEAANGRIQDVDVTEEGVPFARDNALIQAGAAMLAQASALPSSSLRISP